jgi:hypothetical protein
MVSATDTVPSMFKILYLTVLVLVPKSRHTKISRPSESVETCGLSWVLLVTAVLT